MISKHSYLDKKRGINVLCKFCNHVVPGELVGGTMLAKKHDPDTGDVIESDLYLGCAGKNFKSLNEVQESAEIQTINMASITLPKPFPIPVQQ